MELRYTQLLHTQFLRHNEKVNFIQRLPAGREVSAELMRFEMERAVQVRSH